MSLLTSLVSYWKLDEASGTRVDSHGTNDLTDNNTVGSTTGKISNCASFVRANSERLSKTSNSDLQTGAIDFTIAFWYYLNAADVGGQFLVHKETNDSADGDYRIDRSVSNLRFFLFTSSGVAGSVSISDGSTGAWHYLVAWHDTVEDKVFIQIDNGTPSSATVTGTPAAGSGPFEIAGTPSLYYFDGLIDEFGFWKRVLTSQERTDLYNGGSGLAYSSFGGGATITGPLIGGGHLLGSGPLIGGRLVA